MSQVNTSDSKEGVSVRDYNSHTYISTTKTRCILSRSSSPVSFALYTLDFLKRLLRTAASLSPASQDIYIRVYTRIMRLKEYVESDRLAGCHGTLDCCRTSFFAGDDLALIRFAGKYIAYIGRIRCTCSRAHCCSLQFIIWLYEDHRQRIISYGLLKLCIWARSS